MKKSVIKRAISLIIAVLTVLTSTTYLTSCKDKKKSDEAIETVAMNFTFIVRYDSGIEETYELESNKTFFTDALVDLGYIDAQESEGSFILKSVKGVEANTSETGMMWNLYVNGELNNAVHNTVPLVEGYTYIYALEDIVDTSDDVTGDTTVTAADTAEVIEDEEAEAGGSEETEEMTH